MPPLEAPGLKVNLIEIAEVYKASLTRLTGASGINLTSPLFPAGE